jgi:hypothetical protein
MATYYNGNLFDSNNNAISPRPFYGPIDADADCGAMTLSTTFLADSAGFAVVMPIPLGRQILSLSNTWSRAADTNGTPLLSLAIVVRCVDSSGGVTDTVLVGTGAGVYTTNLGMTAAGTTPTGYIFPLLPNTTGSGVTGISSASSPALPVKTGYALLGLKVLAVAATAQSVLYTLKADWK